MRFFNTAGQCKAELHYMLPPTRRLPTVRGLIDQQKYFVLHAPRQVGKSTAMQALAEQLTHEGRYLAAMLTLETGGPFGDNVADAELAILQKFRQVSKAQLPPELQPPPFPSAPPGSAIAEALAAWVQASPRPLVLFLDEIDTLKGATLESVLRQLRAGYNDRPKNFPWSLALFGMRDVRDYRYSGAANRSSGGSPFNIKDASLTLRSFTAEEVAELVAQHTAETGQAFSAQAVARIFELTQGQPWLVNALARQLVETVVVDSRQEITAEHVEEARELLIQRRDTHLDSLAERLREERVRRIIQPILVGSSPDLDVLNDDLLYVRDLGLIAPDSPVRIANPIYQEVIPRSLSWQMQEYLDQKAAWYKEPDGSLDMVLLLATFQEFFTEHSEAWLNRFHYQEAGPHLLLMAFLQRVINGGGRITRELAVGSGRADLVVQYGGKRAVLELKIRRGNDTEKEGIDQLSGYLLRLGEPEGYLVLFDRRRSVSWSEKIYLHEAAGVSCQRIFVFGM